MTICSDERAVSHPLSRLLSPAHRKRLNSALGCQTHLRSQSRKQGYCADPLSDVKSCFYACGWEEKVRGSASGTSGGRSPVKLESEPAELRR